MKDTSLNNINIKNKTAVMEFILLGLSTATDIQTLLFWVFIFIYTSALCANILLILIICTFRKLHTPMYFLIVNLSFVNVFSISVTTPKFLHNLLTGIKTISFYGCIAQVYLFIWALGTELLLLSFMAFDRYVAICQPLRYAMIMRKQVCLGIASIAWIVGMINSGIHAGFTLKLSFCNFNVINNFFCDVPPLWQLSCSDTHPNEIMTFISSVILGICSCGLTFTSYYFILKTIFRIRSTEGKKKAFSTCSSHFIIVSIFFSSAIYTYIRPSSDYSPDKDKLISLLYSVVTPVANPIIYSLRNKTFIEGLRALIGKIRLSL